VPEHIRLDPAPLRVEWSRALNGILPFEVLGKTCMDRQPPDFLGAGLRRGRHRFWGR
jgi:hypothetical protein